MNMRKVGNAMYVMRFVLYMVCLSAGPWGLADATTYVPKPRSEIVAKSEFIGVVRLAEGRTLKVVWNGEDHRCGYVYGASVLDRLLGDQTYVEFYSIDDLRIGQQYVVFLTNGDPSSQDMVTTSSFLRPSKESRAISQACRATYSGMSNAIRDYTSAFVHRPAAGESWVEYTPFASGDNEIAVLHYEPVNVRISSREASVTVGYRQLWDSFRSNETPQYPAVVLSKQIMKWSDYRDAILREVSSSGRSQ